MSFDSVKKSFSLANVKSGLDEFSEYVKRNYEGKSIPFSQHTIVQELSQLIHCECS